MKDTIISICLLAVIIGFCVFTSLLSENVFSEVGSYVSDASTFAERNDWANAERCYNYAENLYNAKLPILETFIHHQELNDAKDLLVKIGTAIKSKQIESVTEEAASLKSYFDTLIGSNTLNLPNIL